MAKINEAHQFPKSTIPEQAISIDSLKVRIPIVLVDIIDNSVRSSWIAVNEETGEVDPDYFKQNSLTKYIDKQETVKVRFGIERQRTERKTVEEFLTVLLPAKILGSRYFEGITTDNVRFVYNQIMSVNVVSFTFETFTDKSFCTDVDFKLDFICGGFEKLIRQMSSNATPSKVRGDGMRLFTSKDNQGIEFNERKTQRYRTKPFLKLYQKCIELSTDKNKAFTDAHLGSTGIDPNLCRVEATVKNKKHFRQLGIDNTSLGALLLLTDKQCKNIISTAVKCNLEPRVQPIRTPKNMSVNKMIIYKMITPRE